MNSKQRVTEWENIDHRSLQYHTSQWETPKQSTLAFNKFISNEIAKSKNIIDLGAGSGAATGFLADQHKSTHFTAFDYSLELTQIGSKIASQKKMTNLRFQQGDWYDPKFVEKYDGCISLQTLSWLPDYEQPLISIFKNINPDWIAISSLFYEGDITCRIEVEEHKRDRKSFYNIYSLPAVDRLCANHGYVLKKSTPFEIDIDIAKPKDIDHMGTYTKRTLADHPNKFERLQISGPLLMSWYMLLIEKVSQSTKPTSKTLK